MPGTFVGQSIEDVAFVVMVGLDMLELDVMFIVILPAVVVTVELEIETESDSEVVAGGRVVAGLPEVAEVEEGASSAADGDEVSAPPAGPPQ